MANERKNTIFAQTVGIDANNQLRAHTHRTRPISTAT